MKKINEKELREVFQGIKEGNKDSFTSLYEKYYSLVYGVIFSILKNKENSEDIAQIVFSKIYQLPREKFPEKYEASWLYTVTKNEALQYIRKSKNEASLDSVYDVSDEKNNIDEIIDIQAYREMIAGLSEKEKEIVSLKVLSQFTFKKIGQILQMPTGTVQWSYYKAVSSLKISLSSLAGFIITFVLGIRATSKKKNIKLKEDDIKIENDYIQENESEIMDSESSKLESIEKPSGTISDITSDLATESTTSTTIKNTENVEQESHVNIGFFGASIIFLMIFIIFFKKYQQKRKVKTSKC